LRDEAEDSVSALVDVDGADNDDREVDDDDGA
jgi:hypothetical protein